MATINKYIENGHVIRYTKYRGVKTYRPHVGKNGKLTRAQKDANAYMAILQYRLDNPEAYKRGLLAEAQAVALAEKKRIAKVAAIKAEKALNLFVMTEPKNYIDKYESKDKETTEMIKITDSKGIERVWKGDPMAETQIAQWKKSYQGGYKPTVISPRTSGGSFAGNKKETAGYEVLSREEQAVEIAQSLKGETNIPVGIIQTLQKTLKPIADKLHTTEAPVATDTRAQTGGLGATASIMGLNPAKMVAVTLAGFVIIFGVLHLGKSR